MDDATPKPSQCRNCEFTLTGEYCARCGQRDLDFRRDWRGIISEVSSTFLNLDGKVPQGLFALLFRPGYLTKRFLEGARASQIPPLRLYLLISLCFFLWIVPSPDEAVGAGADGTAPAVVVEDGTPPEGAFETWIVSKLEDPQAISAQFMAWLPRAFLIGVPILALFLRLIFWRQPFVYLEHLVISLHLQSFGFLWILVIAALATLIGFLSDPFARIFESIAFWWLIAYPVFALRRLFGFSWLKAIGISIFLEFGYLILLGFGMAAVATIVLYFA